MPAEYQEIMGPAEADPLFLRLENSTRAWQTACMHSRQGLLLLASSHQQQMGILEAARSLLSVLCPLKVPAVIFLDKGSICNDYL